MFRGVVRNSRASLSWAIDILLSVVFFLYFFSKESLKLKEGANSVTFSVTTKYQVQMALVRNGKPMGEF